MELSRVFGIAAAILMCLLIASVVVSHPFLTLLLVLLVIARHLAQVAEVHARLKRYARVD